MNSIMRSKKNFLVFAMLAASSAGVQARVYECNVGGVTVYTSRPSANCRAPDLPRLGSYTSLPAPRRIAPPPAAPAEAVPTQAKARGGTGRIGAPIRTAPPMQMADAAAEAPKSGGNAGRRAILEQELANERKALAVAQNELSAARAQKNAPRAGQLAASIQDRQQNIQALQRELGRM